MNLRPSNLLDFGVLTLGFVFILSKTACSQEDTLGSSGSLRKFIDTVCTIPYLNETNITDPNHQLVVESKQVILNSGISEAYFDAHFKFLCAVDDAPHGRLVRWRYSIGEFSLILNDNVGYSDEIGGRINLHSFGNDLKGLGEVRHVISKKKAEKIMKQCIGEFENPSVFWGGVEPGYNKARLYFVASLVKVIGGIQMPWLFGYVDLETGRCFKQEVVSGPRHD